MIKPIAFTHDIDRSYLSTTKKSKKSIKRTRTQNYYDLNNSINKSKHINDNNSIKNEKPELIRKKINSSDEDFQIRIQKVVKDITDKEGLLKLAELHEKKRLLKKKNPTSKISGSKDQLKVQSLKSTSKDNFHHFKPTPPKNSGCPGTKRRPIPSRSKMNKYENDFTVYEANNHRTLKSTNKTTSTSRSKDQLKVRSINSTSKDSFNRFRRLNKKCSQVHRPLFDNFFF